MYEPRKPEAYRAFPSKGLIAVVLNNQLSSETLFEAIDSQQCVILLAWIPPTEIVNGKPFVAEAEQVQPVMQAVRFAYVSRRAVGFTAK